MSDSMFPAPDIQGEGEEFNEIDLVGAASGTVVLTSRRTGDTLPNVRARMTADGQWEWGPADGTYDVTLARSASGTLTLTGALAITTTLSVGTTVVSHLNPGTANTYDLGSTTWRTGYFGTSIVFDAGGLLSWSTDLHLTREAAAALQMGQDVNGAAVAQTFKAHDGITGTDIAGANLTLAGGRGTGAGAVGNLILSTSTLLGSGTTAQTLSARVTITGASITATLPLLGAAGTAAAPGLSFAADATKGFYSSTTNSVAYTAAGSARIQFGGNHAIAGGSQLAWTSGDATAAADTILVRGGAAGVLHFHNTTATFATLHIMGTRTSASSYEALTLTWSAINGEARIGTTTASGTIRNLNLTVANAAASAVVLHGATSTITGAVTDGYTAGLRLSPTYNAATALTVTRHNYIDINTPVLGGAGPAAVTDACVFRFDAAAGTHKAVDAGTTKVTVTAVDAWPKININGTLYYIPAYTSKTA